MSVEDSTPDEHEQQLDAIIAAYYRAVEAGANVDQKEFISQHPEFQRELSEFFASLGMFPTSAPESCADPALEPTLTSVVAGRDKSATGFVVRYFGEYEILEELGAGGMGVVYKARQSKLKRIVAIKMIRSGELASSQDVQRFEAEAKAAARLSHPGIVSLHEVGIHHGHHFYTMDYVEGGSLSQLHRDKPIESRRAATLVRGLAESMSYAHEQGIVHRDLKPANILLTTEGTPRITDFGLAKRMRTEEESYAPTMTESGQILGTAGYMSPEQAAGKSQLVGPPADIYSLGAVLYALLTSRAPFVGETPSQTILQVLHNEPVSPRALNADVPRDLETICLKCLQKEPHKRYGTAKGLADDLTLYLEGKPVRARPVSSVERGWRWCRRNVVLTALMVMIMLVAFCSPLLLLHHLMTLVDGVQDARGAMQPKMIDELHRYPDPLVKRVLVHRFHNESDLHRKRSIAYALASFGVVETEFLVSQIDSIDEADTGNLIDALARDQITSLAALRAAAVGCTIQKRWREKSQLGIVALQLGDSGTAEEMCQLQNKGDLVQRSVFVDEFPRWDIDLIKLATHVVSRDEVGLRTAVMLGIGKIPAKRLTPKEQGVWQKLAENWFLTISDTTTHSACDWLLRRWKVALPEISPTDEGKTNRDWNANSQGVTMLRIPAGPFGPFQRLARSGAAPRYKDAIISEAFWLSDREITVGQFQTFLDDPDAVKPDSWISTSKLFGDADDFPVRNVSWNDAVLYCNWLSIKESLPPAYVETSRVIEDGGKLAYTWSRIEGARGYRLPREIEWEYACRAGTTTNFSSGDDIELFGNYAHFVASAPESCGVKLPNAWGLWDMHGNVWEWCDDLARLRFNHTVRGGSFNGTAASVDCDSVGSYSFNRRFTNHGFRVARTDAPDVTSEKGHMAGREESTTSAIHHVVLRSRSFIDSGGARLTSVQHSSDGTQILVGGHDWLARLLKVRTGEMIQAFRGHESVVWSVALSPDGKTAVTGSEDKTLRLWDIESGKELDRFDAGGIFSCVRYSSDGTQIFATNWDGKVRIWQLADGKLGEPVQFPFDSPTLDIVFLTKETFAFGNVAGNVLKCNSHTRNIERTFAGHSGWVHSVASLNDGTQFLSASHDSTISLWNTDSEDPDRTYSGHHGIVNEVRMLPGNKNFLSCGADRTLRLWEVVSGTELARGFGTGELRGLSVAADGKSCFTAGLDGSLWEWEIPNLPNKTTSGTLLLLSPEVGAILSNGKSAKTEEYTWAFDWADVTDATRYHLVVKGSTARIAVVDRDDIPTSEWRYTKTGVVTDAFRRNWTWKVRAFANGGWTEWSDTRTFHVETAR